MSFDLFPEETVARQDALNPVTFAPVDTFDNFFSGAGNYAMQGFAKTARAIDMAGAVVPIIQDKFTGGTEEQDKYFKGHDEVFNRAVDYWTPKQNEVGVAGEVVGQLLGTLPQVFMSPSLAVASAQLSTAEDLTRQGVDTTKAQSVGAVQAAGLGLGIWMPILGKTLTQRVLAGGIGFNVAQGAAMRGASGAILEGTPAEGSYKAFDGKSVTLDVLLGAAFGGMAHINPAMRVQGEDFYNRFDAWAKNLKPSEVDALTVLKQAEHLNVESMPGKPVDLADTDAHVQRIRQAINDLASNKQVNVENMPEPKFEPDAAKAAEVADTAKFMQGEVTQIAKDSGIDLNPTKSDISKRGDTSEPWQMTQKQWNKERESVRPNIAQSRPTKASGFQAAASAKRLDKLLYGVTDDASAKIKAARLGEITLSKDEVDTLTERLAAPVTHKDVVQKAITEGKQVPTEVLSDYPDLNQLQQAQAGQPAKAVDPLHSEAARFVSENSDMNIIIGKNLDGTDITTTPRQMLEDADAMVKATETDAKLFAVAAGCIMGAL